MGCAVAPVHTQHTVACATSTTRSPLWSCEAAEGRRLVHARREHHFRPKGEPTLAGGGHV